MKDNRAKRAAMMRQAIESGESFQAIAKRFGVAPNTVAAARARWGLQARIQDRDATRDAFIREQLLGGMTLQQVGDALDITRERIRQIANRIGVDIKTRKSAARQVRATQSEARKVGVTCEGCPKVLRLSPSSLQRFCSYGCFAAYRFAHPAVSCSHVAEPWNQQNDRARSCRACHTEYIRQYKGREAPPLPKYAAQLALHNADWLVEVTGANRITATTANKSVTASMGSGSPWVVRDGAGRHLGYATTAAALLELAEHAWKNLPDVRQHTSTVAPSTAEHHPKTEASFA